ncbi:MAG: S-adenosyl-l-methionine hydroxide adenosyltransferase family protein [Candidatus Electrothrix sp. YB6]
MQAAGIISLLTDFGLTDPYVGQLKGAILRRNPAARLVDLSHAVPRQDILTAAFFLHSSYRFFPAWTVHLAVVDPGVGSRRNILLAVTDDHLFVAPDNGILSLLLAEGSAQGRSSKIYRVEQTALFASSISSTFHGRDIMGPVAAALAGGLPPVEVGPELRPDACVRLHLPEPVISAESITGQVLQIDHFGNIRSNISQVDLDRFSSDVQGVQYTQCVISLHGREILGISMTYADAEPGSLIALLDSAGYLEIAVNMNSAAQVTRCRTGDPVTVTTGVVPPLKKLTDN